MLGDCLIGCQPWTQTAGPRKGISKPDLRREPQHEGGHDGHNPFHTASWACGCLNSALVTHPGSTRENTTQIQSISIPEPSFDTLKSAQKQKTLISKKKCYKPLSAHLVVSFCRAPPHIQTAGSPRILATYTDTITLCLGSRCLGSPQPTSFAAAASKSSNSLGWAELDT